MAIGHDETNDRFAWVRHMINFWWGRELASVEEQTFWMNYLTEHGSDLTLAAILDHQNRRDLAAKRGW